MPSRVNTCTKNMLEIKEAHRWLHLFPSPLTLTCPFRFFFLLSSPSPPFHPARVSGWALYTPHRVWAQPGRETDIVCIWGQNYHLAGMSLIRFWDNWLGVNHTTIYIRDLFVQSLSRQLCSVSGPQVLHCESKKAVPLLFFYFYCGFGNYWPILIVLSVS